MCTPAEVTRAKLPAKGGKRTLGTDRIGPGKPTMSRQQVAQSAHLVDVKGRANTCVEAVFCARSLCSIRACGIRRRGAINAWKRRCLAAAAVFCATAKRCGGRPYPVKQRSAKVG
jgi:hypothetical protein